MKKEEVRQILAKQVKTRTPQEVESLLEKAEINPVLIEIIYSAFQTETLMAYEQRLMVYKGKLYLKEPFTE